MPSLVHPNGVAGSLYKRCVSDRQEVLYYNNAVQGMRCRPIATSAKNVLELDLNAATVLTLQSVASCLAVDRHNLCHCVVEICLRQVLQRHARALGEQARRGLQAQHLWRWTGEQNQVAASGLVVAVDLAAQAIELRLGLQAHHLNAASLQETLWAQRQHE